MRACRKRPLPPVLPLLLPLVLLLPAPPPKLIAVCLRGGGLSSVGVGPERWDGRSEGALCFTILRERAAQDKARQGLVYSRQGEDGLWF
jgi:hypothetical protein